MNLFDFYSRTFKEGELVAVFKTAQNLLGYGILVTQVNHTDSQKQNKAKKVILSDWSSYIGNSAWVTYINDELIIINEFDMEKL